MPRIRGYIVVMEKDRTIIEELAFFKKIEPANYLCDKLSYYCRDIIFKVLEDK